MKKYRLLRDLPFCGSSHADYFMRNESGKFSLGGHLGMKNQFLEEDIKSLLGTWLEEVKPERWRPEEHESFWQIDFYGTVSDNRLKPHCMTSLKDSYSVYNVWQTREQALEAARRCLKVRKAYAEELAAKES